jgi:hypothetical protein
MEMVFIRAPIINRTGPSVKILARSQGNPVLMRQGQILIATFHPELTSDTTVHHYFVRMAGGEINASAEDPILGLAGSGKELWSTERGDEYVQRLRDKTE